MPANSRPGSLPTARALRGEIRLAGARATQPGFAAQVLFAGRGAALAAPLLAGLAGLTVLPSVFARAFGLL